MTSRDYRAKARQALQGDLFGTTWISGVLIAVIFGAITAALSTASVGLLGALAAGILSFGMARAYVNLMRGRGLLVEDMFCGLREDLTGNLILGLMSTILIALWSLLLVIPGIVKAYDYAMMFYIKQDHSEYDWRRCLDESTRMMRGHRWQLLSLDASFIGWEIVGALCFGVGTLWVAAYHATARAAFYEDIRKIPEVGSMSF